jgi:hypothetical protein
MKIPGIIALLIILGVGLVHAASTGCESNCCINNGGGWVSGDNTCDLDPASPDYDSYASCAQGCSGGSSGSDCCGSIIFRGLVTVAALKTN